MSGDGFGNLLDQCLGVRPGEQVVLLTDGGTDEGVVARLLESVAERDGIPLVARIPAPVLPGAEPPGAVAAMMLEAGADHRARRACSSGPAGHGGMPRSGVSATSPCPAW